MVLKSKRKYLKTVVPFFFAQNQLITHAINVVSPVDKKNGEYLLVLVQIFVFITHRLALWLFCVNLHLKEGSPCV